MRDENSVSNTDSIEGGDHVTVIPSPHKVTQQILNHCHPFLDLKIMFADSNTPKRIFFFKAMSCLGQISPHRRDETWSPNLWQTFFVMTMGTLIPVISEKPLVDCEFVSVKGECEI